MMAKAPKISETAEHRTIAAYFRRIGLGGNAIAIHIRNERGSAWERIIAAQMGIMAKIPDWLFFNPVSTPYGKFVWAGASELKERGWKARRARTGNYTEHETQQLACHERLRRAGVVVEIHETLDEVLEFLGRHNVPLRSESLTTERIRRGMVAGMAGAGE